MKFYQNRTLIAFNGKPISRSANPADGDTTLGEVAVSSLVAEVNGDSPTGEAKFRMHNLAKKIHSSQLQGTCDDTIAEAQFIDLPAEDIALIKKRIGLAMTSVVAGAAWEAVELSPKPQLIDMLALTGADKTV